MKWNLISKFVHKELTFSNNNISQQTSLLLLPKTYDYSINANIIDCACGCGGKTKDRTRNNKPKRFIQGHNALGHKMPHHVWLYMKNRIGEKHHLWTGGRIINSTGYVLIMNPQHPYADRDGYVEEHRLVMEKKVGRFLTRNEIVHHINHVKTDNRIENLQLMTRAEHTRLHMRKKSCG